MGYNEVVTNEYFTEALVLDKEPVGEADLQISLYTRDLGKITARAVGARKIVSKLASHLEPLNFVSVRLIQKNRFQAVDALKTGALSKDRDIVAVLQLIKELSAEGQPDYDLWDLIKSGQLSGGAALSALGFDSRFAVCESCGTQKPGHFLIRQLEYFCSSCLVKSGCPASFALE